MSDQHPHFRSCCDGKRMLAASLIVLFLLTVLYTAWPVCRAFLPLEIDANEPWNAYHADDARDRFSLYPDATGFVVNNYPPLSFYLVGAISTLTFDALYVGRALSVFAIIMMAPAIFSIIRQFGGSRLAGLVGALWFCATLARFFDGYVGMNDPNLVALAVMVCALAWLLRRRANGRAVEPAIVLMVAAGFYKHNLLAVPVTAVAWLALSDFRVAMRAALVGVSLAVLGLILCGLIYGDVFFHNLLMPREYSLRTAVGGLGRLQWIAPAFVIFGIWAWHQRQGEAIRFSLLFVTIAFLFQFLQKLGAGVADNAQFELIVATAVGLGLAFEGILAIPAARVLGAHWSRLAVVLILITRLMISLRMSPYLLIASPDFRAELRQRTAIVASETARIAAIPGPVICTTLTVCRWAGKPFLYDSSFVQQRMATGRTTREEVDRRQRELGYRFEPVDPRSVADWR